MNSGIGYYYPYVLHPFRPSRFFSLHSLGRYISNHWVSFIFTILNKHSHENSVADQKPRPISVYTVLPISILWDLGIRINGLTRLT